MKVLLYSENTEVLNCFVVLTFNPFTFSGAERLFPYLIANTIAYWTRSVSWKLNELCHNIYSKFQGWELLPNWMKQKNHRLKH